MNKLKEIINFLKTNNSGILSVKINILRTIEEFKKKNFSFTANKKFTLIYFGIVFFIMISLGGADSKNYIEVEALTCTNKNGKTIYKVSKDEITIVALYSKMMGMNKNMIVKGKNDDSFKLITNDKTGFTYSRYFSFLKKTYQYRYDFKKNQMFTNGQKDQDCERKSSFKEVPKKARTKAKLSDIKDAFKHATKYKWDTGMACNLNGGAYREFSKKYGELLTLNGKQQIGVRREVQIEKISNHKFKIKTDFYNNSAMFRAYGNKYPVTITETTYELVTPDTIETNQLHKMADFDNLSRVSYKSKKSRSKTQICD